MRYVIPVLCGLIGTFIVGLALFPLVSIVVHEFFYLSFGSRPPDAGKRDLIMISTIATWILASTANGGFVCVQVSRLKTRLTVSLLIVVALSIGAILLGKDFFEGRSILFICVFIGGYIIGAWLGMRYKNKQGRSGSES